MIRLKKNIDTVIGSYAYLESKVVKMNDLRNVCTMLLLCVVI